MNVASRRARPRRHPVHGLLDQLGAVDALHRRVVAVQLRRSAAIRAASSRISTRMCPRKMGAKAFVSGRQRVADHDRAEVERQLGEGPGPMKPVVIAMMLHDAGRERASPRIGASRIQRRLLGRARGRDDRPRSASPARPCRPESRDRRRIAAVGEVVHLRSAKASAAPGRGWLGVSVAGAESAMPRACSTPPGLRRGGSSPGHPTSGADPGWTSYPFLVDSVPPARSSSTMPISVKPLRMRSAEAKSLFLRAVARSSMSKLMS